MDIIRVLAMLLVIVLHTILSFTLRPDFFGTKLWFLFEPLVALSKTSVLLFFMLSGYLVIGKNRTIGENWKKITKVILVPFVFFSLLDVLYELHTALVTGVYSSAFWTAQAIKFVSFPASSLWFLVVLFFLYLLNPIWQPLFAKGEQPQLARYVTLLAFILSIGITLLNNPANIATGWLGFLCFYLYGGLVKNAWVRFAHTKPNVFLALIGFSITILGDYLSRGFGGYLQSLMAIPVAVMAIGIFNLLISCNFTWLTKDNSKKKITTFIMWLAKLSFGIYLIHTFVVAFLPVVGFTFDHLPLNVYLYNIINYTVVLVVSIALTYLVQKIPKVRAIIGM